MPAQFLVIHTWPDKSVSVMPSVWSNEVAAGIHCDHCNAIKHDRPGHVYSVATVSALLHVSERPRPKDPDNKPRVLTDEQVSALAAV